MVDTEFLRTSDGIEITITKEMMEDFYVLSSIYDITVRELIKDVFDGELISNT